MAVVKMEAAASVGGAGFGAWRPDSTVPGHGAAPDMVGHTGGDDGSDIGRCQSRRRWSNAASACGGVTRAAESGPALRGPVGGGGGRRSCAAATCSRLVDAPLKGLPWGTGTMAMAVKAGTGPASRPGECARGFLGAASLLGASYFPTSISSKGENSVHFGRATVTPLASLPS